MFTYISEYKKILLFSSVVIQDKEKENDKIVSKNDSYKIFGQHYIKWVYEKYAVEESTAEREAKFLHKIFQFTLKGGERLTTNNIYVTVLNLKQFLKSITHVSSSYKRKHCDAVSRMLVFLKLDKTFFNFSEEQLREMESNLLTEKSRYFYYKILKTNLRVYIVVFLCNQLNICVFYLQPSSKEKRKLCKEMQKISMLKNMLNVSKII